MPDAADLARVRNCIDYHLPGLLPTFDALVAENRRLREALTDLVLAGDDVEFVGIWESGAIDRFVLAMRRAVDALAGSPAANEEQQ